MAAKFEIRSPKAGQFRWVLTSQGRTLATGETYSRRVSAEKAIDSLHKAAATATIDDTTKKMWLMAENRSALMYLRNRILTGCTSKFRSVESVLPGGLFTKSIFTT